MAKFARSQLGTKNSKNYSSGSGKITQTRSPWGKAIATKVGKAVGKVSGSSTRSPKSDAALAPQTAGYPANKPYAWPVDIDFVNHVRQPSESGNNTNTINRHNAAVEHAYTRAGYQNSP